MPPGGLQSRFLKVSGNPSSGRHAIAGFQRCQTGPASTTLAAMQKATPLILVLILAVTATFLSLRSQQRPPLHSAAGRSKTLARSRNPRIRRRQASATADASDGQGDAHALAAGGIGHRAGYRRHLRHPRKRPALHHLSEHRAAQARFAAPAHRRRLADGGGRPARTRPFPRTHGFQRHQKLLRRRSHSAHAAARHRLRRPCQCLHLLRRDGLHARPAGSLRRTR